MVGAIGLTLVGAMGLTSVGAMEADGGCGHSSIVGAIRLRWSVHAGFALFGFAKGAVQEIRDVDPRCIRR